MRSAWFAIHKTQVLFFLLFQGNIFCIWDGSLSSTPGYVFTGFGCLHRWNEKGSDPKRIQVEPASLPGVGALHQDLNSAPSLSGSKMFISIHTYTYTHECVHMRTHISQGRILVLLTFNVLILKFEAPTGCLKRLIQPVCLGAILFTSLLVAQRTLCFLQTLFGWLSVWVFGYSWLIFPNL